MLIDTRRRRVAVVRACPHAGSQVVPSSDEISGGPYALPPRVAIPGFVTMVAAVAPSLVARTATFKTLTLGFPHRLTARSSLV
jgi:hypothetical protein